MKQMPYKSGYGIATYSLHLCLLAIGFILIGNTSIYANCRLQQYSRTLLLHRNSLYTSPRL